MRSPSRTTDRSSSPTTTGSRGSAPDGTRGPGPDLFAGHPDDRWNDGTCDARGRFLVGTVSLDRSSPLPAAAPVDGDTATVLDDDLGLSNGLAFSPDGSLLYSVDSLPGRRVWVRDYDQDSGATGPRRLALELSDAVPDGLCVDTSGNLWLAAWSRGQVRCYSPAGDLLDVIELPAAAHDQPGLRRTRARPAADHDRPRRALARASRRSTRCRAASSSPGPAAPGLPTHPGPDSTPPPRRQP